MSPIVGARRLVMVAVIIISLMAPSAFAQTQSKKPSTRPAAGPAPAPAAGQKKPAAKPASEKRSLVPFQLSKQEQAELNAVLVEWEKACEGIRTFQCNFSRLEYDATKNVTDQDGNPVPQLIAKGQIKYAAPDKGMIRDDSNELWDDAAGKHVATEKGDIKIYWICDGKSLIRFAPEEKKLYEYPLPEELQGSAIRNCPLPFVFGSTAAELNRRYYMRLQTPPNVKDQVWIEVYPRAKEEQAFYYRAMVILNAEDLMVQAVQLELTVPKKEGALSDFYEVYTFTNQKPNNPWEKIKADFSKPKLPRGWTREVVEPAPPPLAENSQKPANGAGQQPRQAQRPPKTQPKS